MNQKKHVILGITGGIAAYKAAQLTSNLKKKGYDVHVIMTANATQFITPLTLETLSGNRVSVDTFDRNFEYNVQHVSLAKLADVFVIAPASANIIAKAAWGLADDMLSTTLLASRCEKIICPAMNTGMLDNPATQANLQTLRQRGMRIVEAQEGLLACGDVGRGRMAEPEEIEDEIERVLTPKILTGKKVLVSAGATKEALDPVRYLTNHSSGKMGYAIARAARNAGAQVVLVHGPTALKPIRDVQDIQIVSAAEMAQVILKEAPDCDLVIKAAAVADYTPARFSEQKIKKSGTDLSLPLQRTPDILKLLAENRTARQVLVGFAMETEDLLTQAQRKLHEKHVDLIVANDLRQPGAGFQGDTNCVTYVSKQGMEAMPMMSKTAVAEDLIRRCAVLLKEREAATAC